MRKVSMPRGQSRISSQATTTMMADWTSCSWAKTAQMDGTVILKLRCYSTRDLEGATSVGIASNVMFCPRQLIVAPVNPAEPMKAPSSALQQPIPFDASGDMQVSLLGFPYGDDKKENLKMWRNNWKGSNGTELFTLCA